MPNKLTANERREKIVQLIKNAQNPLCGSYLGKQTGVSRQVVVQDIALLRSEGYPILSTARGYIFEKSMPCIKLFKMYHTNEQTEDELNTIVDLGGVIMDVMVNHRAYGIMQAKLNIRSRRDVQLFMQQLRTGKSVPLLNITSGYHFHHIAAQSDEILKEIELALRKKHFLAEFLEYEKKTV